MDDLSRILKNLKDKSPIFGKGRRRKAVEELGKIGTAEVVPYLAESLYDPDIDIRRAAFLQLSRLKDKGAIDCLCSLYLKDRDKKIWEIITNTGFTPSSTKERLYFLIKTGQVAKCIPPREKDIPFLIEMLNDEALNKDALRILSSIKDPTLQEVVFNIFFLKADPKVLQFLINTGWLPQNEGGKLIFYLFLERYEDALFLEKRKSNTFVLGYKLLGENTKHMLISILFKNPDLSSLLYLLIAFENNLERLRLIFKKIIENNNKDALIFFLKKKAKMLL